MLSIFWRLLHRYGPEWAIHLLCSLCREEGLCPKCIIDWEKMEPTVGPPARFVGGTLTTGTTAKWTYTITTGFLRSGD